MALNKPSAADLFGDVSAKEAASRTEDFNAALNKSFSNPSFDPQNTSFESAEDSLAALAANKSMSPEALASVQNALAAQRAASTDINKEITTTQPLYDSFAAFDLEAPAKLLTPRPTPLRNKIPRKKGIGTSHRIKRILGYTGTGTGGNAGGNIWPGLEQQSGTASSPIYGARGPMIQYSADNLVTPYHSYGLSDSVTFDAFFSGQGYQDLRQLSSTSTLYATMLMEERMMLMARNSAMGTGTGYLQYPAPLGTQVQLWYPSATGPQVTPITNSQNWYQAVGVNGGWQFMITASAGAFGDTGMAAQAGVFVADPTGSGNINGTAIFIPLQYEVPGAVGYNIYISDSTGNFKFLETSGIHQGYAAGTSQIGVLVQGNFNNAYSGATIANANTTAYENAYDGIIPILSAGTGGAVNQSLNGAQFSTSNPGVEFQNIFEALYNNVKADPDEILLNGGDRRRLSDAIKNGSTANYRINLEQSNVGGYVGGATIDSLYNEITGKMVSLTVHPWLPQGVAPVMSYTLPIPDTEVSDVWSNFLVQDYMGIQWPIQKFTYDFSTYFRGTFQCQAPAWNGILTNIGAQLNW